jgi:hypothetical protein
MKLKKERRMARIKEREPDEEKIKIPIYPRNFPITSIQDKNKRI